MAEIRIERKKKSRAWPLLLALALLAIAAVGAWLFWVEPERRAAGEGDAPAAAEQGSYEEVPAHSAQPYTLPDTVADTLPDTVP